MRILGLDLGERRVGVAISDSIGMLAHPLTTLLVTGDRSLLEQVQGLIQEHEIERLVVGLPFNNDGSLGPRGERIEALAAKLADATLKPVERIDERFTSREAQRALLHAPKKVRNDKTALDMASATIILQSYLDTHR
jgi:putative Holliday junction resolvase